MKKTASLALVFVLLFSLCAFSTFAAEITVSDATALRSAVESAAAGDTIKLEASIDLGNSGLAVKMQLTIDLNGFTLTSTDPTYATLYAGTAGDLTVTDSSDAKNGSVTNTAGNALGNFGKLTVDAGTFTGDYAFYNWNNSTSPIATVSGGTFVATGSDDLAIANCGELTVSGNADVQGVLDSSAKLTISGGTIETLRLTEPDYAPACGTSACVTGANIGTIDSFMEASVNGEFFPTLAQAVDLAGAGDTVKLAKDVDLGSNGLAVKKQLTIDLNGYALTSADVTYATLYTGTAGDLTVTDSSDAKNGSVANTAGNALGNFGKLTVEAGTFTGDYAFYNWNNSTSPIATVSGGTFVANGSEDIAIANCGELTVSGSTDVQGTLDSSAKLTISGGTFEEVAVTEPDYGPACGTSAAISGGTYDVKPVDTYIVEGYEAVGSGPYTVQAKQPVTPPTPSRPNPSTGVKLSGAAR